jgi:probable selenium-dependent hydroxylase accessory protein YqeC
MSCERRMSELQNLLDLLEARSGIVCAVGAGGKKSALFALAVRHPGRVAFTTTVHTLPPPPELDARIVIAEAEALDAALQAARDARFVAYACPGDKPGRLTGVPAAQIAQWHATGGFELTLVKADGARMRWAKAPGDDEPVLPPGMTTLVPVLSARALGEPLGERIAHRVDRLAALTGASPGQSFDPAHAARLLASEQGLLKGTAGARVVPVINMVDDPARLALATETARRALELTDRFDFVVLARLRDPDPVVAVVER